MAAPLRGLCFSARNLLRDAGLLCHMRPVNRIIALSVFKTRQCQATRDRCVHTSAANLGLREFFDTKDNWGASEVRVGRPWRKEELRLKDNSDLHKLWYVLLKERNKVMTMAEAYDREKKLFPNPERLEKVEESMENLLDVVAERDRAVNLLETGKTGEPEPYRDKDILGIPRNKIPTEHFVPEELNEEVLHKREMAGRWQERWLVRLEEKRLRHARWREMARRKRQEKLRSIFPDVEFDEDDDDKMNEDIDGGRFDDFGDNDDHRFRF